MQSARDIRRAAGKSQLQVAAEAGASLPTVRLYEANREAVGEAKRVALDATYTRLAQTQQPPEPAPAAA